MTMKNKYIIILLNIFCCVHAENYNWYTSSVYYPESLKESDYVNQFIINNDSIIFKKITNTHDPENKFCHYESEFFLYSMMMTLDFKNEKAANELDRIINNFYKKYKIEKGLFVKDFLTFFHSDKSSIGNYTFEQNDEKFVRLISILFDNKKVGKVKSAYLKKIISKGDSTCYSSLEDTLKQKCQIIESLSPEDRFIYNYRTSKILLYSIYHIDRNNSPDGYFFLYNTIVNFYLEKEIVPSTDTAKLLMYLLEKAAEMKLPSAIREYNQFK